MGKSHYAKSVWFYWQPFAVRTYPRSNFISFLDFVGHNFSKSGLDDFSECTGEKRASVSK